MLVCLECIYRSDLLGRMMNLEHYDGELVYYLDTLFIHEMDIITLQTFPTCSM